jgi:subtilisin family serine protease
MRFDGHIQLTFKPGESPSHVPNHLDHLLGACRPAGQLDGGPVDRVLSSVGGGFRALGVYTSRRNLGHVGEHHRGFDDFEEDLGLSRTYKVRIAEPARDQQVVDRLRELPNIEMAVVQCLMTAPMAAAGRLDGASVKLTLADARRPHERIHVAEALEIEPGNESVTVGVVDTGVSLGHPEFQRKLLAGYDTVNLGMGAASDQVALVGDSRGLDFNPSDEVNHGSHVAGIIGAQGWRIPRGVGGRCLILPIRVLAAAVIAERRKRSGVGALSDINAGLKVCVDLGAKVINMSFGTSDSNLHPDDPRPHARVIRYAARYGCVMIAASGNSGLEERYYPAAHPEVIAVGSVDEWGQRSAFSTYGPHISICAPGERIISAGRRGYLASSGTSHAAPFVAGVAALLVSRARRSRRELDGAEVKRLLIESATPLQGGFNKHTGSGLLNALAALRRLERLLVGDQFRGGIG